MANRLAYGGHAYGTLGYAIIPGVSLVGDVALAATYTPIIELEAGAPVSVESNITIEHRFYKGEDKTLRFRAKTASGGPYDASGTTLVFNVWLRGAAGAAKITISGSDIVVSDGFGTGDIITLTVPAASTSVLPAVTYAYELRQTDSGDNHVLAFGLLQLQNTRT